MKHSLQLKLSQHLTLTPQLQQSIRLLQLSTIELNQERYRLINPSEIVEAETGTPGVAEAAALKAGTLVVPKRKSRRATCAIGRANSTELTLLKWGLGPRGLAS